MKKSIYEDEWIKIVHKESKPKTEVYDVFSKCNLQRCEEGREFEATIGEIRWDKGWRHYVWQDPLIKLSDRCLFSLGYFVMKKNIEHKGKKQFVEEFIEMMDKEFGKNWDGQLSSNSS